MLADDARTLSVRKEAGRGMGGSILALGAMGTLMDAEGEPYMIKTSSLQL
jgi:hypothetical protein